MWICVSALTPLWVSLNAGIAKSKYSFCQSDLRSGSFSLKAASSIWIILIPFFSRSRTSSRIASAICEIESLIEISSLGNDQFRIVTGPVSIPFIILFVNDWAYTDQSTVIGFSRYTSPQIIGGLTHLVPYDCTHAFSVNRKPPSASPKYSTISFLSYSPWTSTSRPISSWNLTHSAIFFLLKSTYSSLEISPFLNAERLTFTSLVCGNEPIVVVGNNGRLSSIFWSFCLSALAGSLV